MGKRGAEKKRFPLFTVASVELLQEWVLRERVCKKGKKKRQFALSDFGLNTLVASSLKAPCTSSLRPLALVEWLLRKKVWGLKLLMYGALSC